VFSGIYQILHTPFDEAGRIDWASYGAQIDYCLAAGVHGLVAPAMASEFFSLSDAERFEVVAFATERIARRVPFIAAVQGITLPIALGFAEHAVAHGAAGLMAMPPYLRKASKAGIEDYFRGLAGMGLPLMIQNAPAPVGTPLAPAELAHLLRSEANVAYVKEETPPILQRIGQTLSLAGDACLGVFGGANGLYLPDELGRGACGNMPAGGLIDLQVRVYDLHAAGERERAEGLHLRLLPLLNYAAIYGVSFHKHVMWRRGVLASPASRDPQQVALDADDVATIARYWAAIADETLPAYPFVP
jgi:dihydrodipicolinate synthase/N-acetylneuraminate lyase